LATRSAWHRLILALFHLPRAVAILLCVSLFVVIATADLVTPPQVDLSLFYVFVILLATWNLGFQGGAVFALGSAAMQWIALSDHSLAVVYSVYWYLWLANRWFTFFIVVALTYPLRVLFDRFESATRTDPLTEAANRTYFAEMLAMQLARNVRSGECFAVAFMDCDDFKQINDHHGHAVGDSVLHTVVQTAKQHTRPSDTVARLGGDEFALLLPGAANADALAVVKRLQSKLAERMIAARGATTLSIGLASFERTTLDVAGVIALCDSLMYRAKRSGRGQIAHEHIAAPPSRQLP